MNPRRHVLMLLVVLASTQCLLTVVFFRDSSAVVVPQQYGPVEIYTNKGGQGPGQYGGSYAIGESITIYMYSSFNGNAILDVCSSRFSDCYEFGEYQISADQTIPVENVVGSPVGQHGFILQVCSSGGEEPSLTQTANCQTDRTWIDVVGSGPAAVTTTELVTTTRSETWPVTTTQTLTHTTTEEIRSQLTVPQAIVTASATAAVTAVATRIYAKRRPGFAFDIQVRSGIDREESSN